MDRNKATPLYVKPIAWVGSSKEDLKEMPGPVRRDIGASLFGVQIGLHPANVKALRGFKGAGVLEIIEDHDGDTYRAVFTVRFASAVYVLHCFQKKSKRGIATPRHDLDLIASRLKQAEELEKEAAP